MGDMDEEEDCVTGAEAGRVVGELQRLLDCLHLALDYCSLRRSQESAEAVVAGLVELARLEQQHSDIAAHLSRTSDNRWVDSQLGGPRVDSCRFQVRT